MNSSEKESNEVWIRLCDALDKNSKTLDKNFNTLKQYKTSNRLENSELNKLGSKYTKCFENIRDGFSRIIFDNEKFHEAKNKYKNIRINIFNKTDDFIKNFNYKADYTMCSIAGLAGLEPTLSIIKISKNVAIANKESIICGWNLINKNLKLST